MAGISTASALTLVILSCALVVIVEMRVAGEMEKRLFNFDFGKCKKLGQNCRGFPRCCGELQCYIEGEINPLSAASSLQSQDLGKLADMAKGVCVPCVTVGLNCLRDQQCCKGLTCNKQGNFGLTGKCKAK